jgi:hypothetical protein
MSGRDHQACEVVGMLPDVIFRHAHLAHLSDGCLHYSFADGSRRPAYPEGLVHVVAPAATAVRRSQTASVQARLSISTRRSPRRILRRSLAGLIDARSEGAIIDLPIGSRGVCDAHSWYYLCDLGNIGLPLVGADVA